MADSFEFSVVLPVYSGVDPTHFREALESIYSQTRLPSEVILVEDGPLTQAHHQVVSRFDDCDPPLRRVLLPERSGAGAANDAGLREAIFPWIAKMDADDISYPDRFQIQLAEIERRGVDVLGGAMEEFAESPENVLGIRRMPQQHTNIAKLMKINNPINHPTVVYRRSLALAVGGYRSVLHMEDYDLMARLLAGGGRMQNLGDPVLSFRTSEATLRRRRQRGLASVEWNFQKDLHGYGLIPAWRVPVNFALRSIFRQLPTPVFRASYRILFHRRPSA